jgi:hypothetical protein
MGELQPAVAVFTLKRMIGMIDGEKKGRRETQT